VAADSPLEAKLATADGAWARDHLVSDVVAWLTTVAADGTPQSSPISFLWDGATIFFYSQPDTRKLRNLERSRRVSFTLRSDDHADHLLIVEGDAAVDLSIPPSDVHPTYRAKYTAPLAHWGMDEAETARSFSVPIRITPTRVRVG
jgi:PPOX class probable F420-dependent enzyme